MAFSVVALFLYTRVQTASNNSIKRQCRDENCIYPSMILVEESTKSWYMYLRLVKIIYYMVWLHFGYGLTNSIRCKAMGKVWPNSKFKGRFGEIQTMLCRTFFTNLFGIGWPNSGYYLINVMYNIKRYLWRFDENQWTVWLHLYQFPLNIVYLN